MREKKFELRLAKRRTIAIFIKLLATRIVANSRLGCWSIFSILEIFFCSSPFACSSSVGVSEKKATSAPEIKAEALIKHQNNPLQRGCAKQ